MSNLKDDGKRETWPVFPLPGKNRSCLRLDPLQDAIHTLQNRKLQYTLRIVEEMTIISYKKINYLSKASALPT